jgi:acyl carrier protein
LPTFSDKDETMNSRLSDTVIAIFRAVEPFAEDEITAETTFDELGIDSLVLIEFAVALQKRFGVPVTDEEITAVASLGATAALVEAKSTALVAG